MRFWKSQPVFTSAAAAVAALAVMLLVRRGVVDVLIMILIGTALVGMYVLRRYARAELLYRGRSEPERPPAGRNAHR
jgi:hypothetical protein